MKTLYPLQKQFAGGINNKGADQTVQMHRLIYICPLLFAYEFSDRQVCIKCVDPDQTEEIRIYSL